MDAGENAGIIPAGRPAQEVASAAARALTLAEGPGPAEERLRLVCAELRSVLADRPNTPRIALNERQLKTLGLVAQGLSNRGIARRLDLAEETVKCHVRLLLDRLNVANRTALALWAVREGLVPLHATPARVSSPP